MIFLLSEHIFTIRILKRTPFSLFLIFCMNAAYVKSNTVVGDSKHSTGVVMAEIVRANIPLKNGVAHLIHRPLMVVDTTVKEFLEVSYGDMDVCV